MAKIEIRTDDLVSVPNAAKILGRPKITLYRWIEKGKLTAVELSGVLFIQTKDLERLKGEESKVATE